MKWSSLLEQLEDDDDALLEHESAVWIVRKEPSGKLRWRMLPLHAALIFQAPFAVVEGLLEVFPAAASQKDDQGMLPLHLAMRNFGSINSAAGTDAKKISKSPSSSSSSSKSKMAASTTDLWQILEELLTVFPAAVFSKDRKGRTPLQGGLLAATGQHKTALTVLQLWTTIQSAANKNSVTQQQQQQYESQLSQLQQQHVATLTSLRSMFWKEQEEAQRQQQLAVDSLQQELEECRARCSALEQSQQANDTTAQIQQENEQLRSLVHQLLEQQTRATEQRQQSVRHDQEQLETVRRQLAQIVGNNNDGIQEAEDEPRQQYKSRSPPRLQQHHHESQRSLADQILEDLSASSGFGDDVTT